VPRINNDYQIFRFLDELYQVAPEYQITKNSKWVIYSDLHVGDGSNKDDFKLNANLFTRTLQDYYLRENFKVILNGDIEELQKFKYKKILNAWPELFDLFDKLNEKGALIKIIGNHDIGLMLDNRNKSRYPLHQAIRLYWKKHPLFIFHGHQASSKYLKYNRLLGITLKYLARPLRIKNFSVSHNSYKQYAIEKKVYHFSVSRRIASVIGHTHRPLFESLYKPDRLKYKIEELCRKYIELNDKMDRKMIKQSIKNYKKELMKIKKKEKDPFFRESIYNTMFTIPCLYNSGCVIGKRGITALEIEKGLIRLVHWFDKNTSKKYLKNYGYDPVKLSDTDYYRMIINEETLDYISARIQLLSN
jgi:UDP-2,3-diacylglucosamine pyrophosphatase LpxH